MKSKDDILRELDDLSEEASEYGGVERPTYPWLIDAISGTTFGCKGGRNQMTHTQITLAAQEAPHYSDQDAFISDMLLSSAFLPPEDETAAPDMSLAPALCTIWTAVNGTFAELLAALGLTQTKCSRRFRIPLRTVQGWKLGERECPLYIRLMMVELCGLI